MLVLGIESTAHTFGVAIIDESLNILADERAVYRPPPNEGIEPFKAAEHHSKAASKVLLNALDKAGVSMEDIDCIGYSMGPGLGPCLRVGATLARYLSLRFKKPLYPVHHGIGHIELLRSFLGVKFPLTVLVSGGHSVITAFKDGRWRAFGETLDITLGNLLDVFARKAGLGFPGGPILERMAKEGGEYIELPYNIKGSNFQFSGLLTRAIQLLEEGFKLRDLAYSLLETAFSIVVEATERALTSIDGIDSIGLTGGVASNDILYEKMSVMAKRHGYRVYRLPKKYNSDNGVQIAVTALKMYTSNVEPVDVENALVRQKWRFDEVDIRW